MIDANFRVCLDACVLASHSVCDLLLRLAEERRLYTPLRSPRASWQKPIVRMLKFLAGLRLMQITLTNRFF